MKIIMVTGGARSGKSTFAEKIALEYFRRKSVKEKIKYVATAEPVDEEFKERIKIHIERRGNEFETIEESIYPFSKLLNSGEVNVAMVECIPTWLGNLYYHKSEVDEIVEKELLSIKMIKKNKNGMPDDFSVIIIVTNEVGFGLVPETKESREYRDKLGIINTMIAKFSDEVYLTVSGIPLKIK